MLKKQIEEKISKTEIFSINKKTAEYILKKLNAFLDKEDSVFVVMDVMKSTDYSYHTVRKYLMAIIEFKPELITKIDRYRYVLKNRNETELHLNDITLPKLKNFGKFHKKATITLTKLYEKYKNKQFNLKDIEKDFDVSYNLAYRTMKKIINTEGLEKIISINLDGIISFKFDNKEMKNIGY